MKKRFLYFLAIAIFCGFAISQVSYAETTQPMVTIEIPASSVDKIDVKYEKEKESKTNKAVEATKDFTDKTVKATKKGYHKSVEATKDFTDKTVKATKKGYKKTVDSTKKGYHKSVEATKEFTDKTIDSTKDAFENLNPNKTVTLEELEIEAAIKTLKNEKKEKKNAYKSRLKDINAQIKAAEYSTTITEVQRQNKIYTLNREKEALENQLDLAMLEYDNKINQLKLKNK